MNKKQLQLGMSQGTASNRLVKDILWHLILQTKQNVCFHCQKPMCRATFSIEHKVPWLDSENPSKVFFDLNNITFAHLKCNFSKARRPTKLTAEEKRRKHAEYMRKFMTKEKRRIKYLRTGY